jgi:FixJ family two-component response regulator
MALRVPGAAAGFPFGALNPAAFEAFPSAADFLASPRLAETACLIADVQMPAMTGLELYRHFIGAGYAIPTILVTAYPMTTSEPAL